MRKTYHILSLGAGVQSTMVALLPRFLPDKIPQFDAAIFADTGDEPAPVYPHLEWLKQNVNFPIIVRSEGNLGDDLIHGTGPNNGFRSIPAYLATQEGEKEGIGMRQCTYNYKVRVIERTIKQEILGLKKGQRVPKGIRVVSYTGLSWDEPNRIHKLQSKITHWQEFRSPLHDLQITRPMAAYWLKDKVPHPVPRSACVFCPFHSNAEWRWLREHDQKGWNRAVMIDKSIRQDAACSKHMVKKMYLHDSCVPLDEADLNDDHPGQQFLFSNDCMGLCGV